MRRIKLAIAVLCLSLTIANAAPARVDQIFDEFSGFNCEEMKARLDNFAIQLMQEQDLQGYVVVYGGKYGWHDEAQAWMKVAKEYLSKTRGIANERLIFINGGYRPLVTMELWLMSKGANPPTAYPTVQPKDVRLKKGKAQKHICPPE